MARLYATLIRLFDPDRIMMLSIYGIALGMGLALLALLGKWLLS